MSYNYIGSELDVFAHATNWKRYLAQRLNPFLGDEVLEVGSGTGSVTRVFNNGAPRRWVCLEPDPKLLKRAQDEAPKHGSNCEYIVGTLRDLPAHEHFDTILYIDVLEHIDDDRRELVSASERLTSEGVICVVAPAYNELYSEFDKAIGHFRRYNKAQLAAIAPSGLILERIEYLDSCGLLASMANRFLLHTAKPNVQQVIFWDRTLVRSSRVIDPLIARMLGKSVLAVWRKPG